MKSQNLFGLCTLIIVSLGCPDPHPNVRENMPQLDDLIEDFDFNQSPCPLLILPANSKPGHASILGA